MRTCLLLLVICACGKRLEKPDPAELAKLEYDAQCAAVAPRAGRCANELIAADLRSLPVDEPGQRELARAAAGGARELTDHEARGIAITSCVGRADRTFPARVLTCWDEDDCTRFADCVTPAR
jgi:hypothetical protein